MTLEGYPQGTVPQVGSIWTVVIASVVMRKTVMGDVGGNTCPASP